MHLDKLKDSAKAVGQLAFVAGFVGAMIKGTPLLHAAIASGFGLVMIVLGCSKIGG